MTPCKHKSWLEIVRWRDEWQILHGTRLRNIVRELRDPTTQRPSIVGLVGRSHKENAMRYLFPVKNRSHRAQGCAVNMNFDSSTKDTANPVIYADWDPEVSAGNPGHNCPDIARYTVDWDCDDSSRLLQALLVRCLFPFADVICLFVDDFTTEAACATLAEWNDIANRKQMAPRLLVAASSASIEVARTLQYISQFSSVSIVDLCDADLLPRASPYRTLREVLSSELAISRRARSEQSHLFSATHTLSFFQSALAHFSTGAAEPFSFIRASRDRLPIDPTIASHFKDFVNILCSKGFSLSEIAAEVATRILFDSLPVGMHHFSPKNVFNILYRGYCDEACKDGPFPADEFCPLVAFWLEKLYSEMMDQNLSAAEAHLLNLRRRIDWKETKVSTFCPICARSHPEHSQECGHGLCSDCVRAYSRPSITIEYHFNLDECPLCEHVSKLVVKQLPPTAGYRAISLDGGGIGGAYTLEALSMLESNLGYPLQDEFDYTIGTSSGGLIALLLFLYGKSVEECIAMFDVLAKRAFAPHVFQTSLFPRIFRDSKYNIAPLEQCLDEAYGRTQKMHDCPPTKRSGTKVAVTVTTTSDATLCLFSNYNANAERAGYKHIHSPDPGYDVLVRDAARATSAAPSFFPVKYIPGEGYVQDGGVGKHNNPVFLTKWEGNAIWSIRPDLTISIGTGYTKSPDQQHLRLHWFWDNFIFRSIRSFQTTYNGEKTWMDYWNAIDSQERERSFRIDLPLDESVALDEVKKMDDIRQAAHESLGSFDFQNIRLAALAAFFFFELDDMPAFSGRLYECRGAIYCRSVNRVTAITNILKEFPNATFTTSSNSSLGSLANGTFCSVCGAYQNKVSIFLHPPGQFTSIYIRFNRFQRRKISGFPNSIAWFVERQQIENAFGFRDHRPSHKGWGFSCCGYGQKRKESPPLMKAHKKRRM